jgi:hypothetical protein
MWYFVTREYHYTQRVEGISMIAPDRQAVESERLSLNIPINLGLAVPTFVALGVYFLTASWILTWAIATLASLLVSPVVMVVWSGRGCGHFLLRVLFVVLLGAIATYGKGNAVAFASAFMVAVWTAMCLSLVLVFELISVDIRSTVQDHRG